jgi:hypothetical protein
MIWILLAGLLLAGTPALEVKRAEQQIHESLMALPEALRADATVIGYDDAGKRVTLEKGNNGMTCWADDPKPGSDEPFYVLCFPESLRPLFERNQELKDQKASNRREVLEAEMKSGKIKMPDMAIRYTLRGQLFVEALPLTVIHVPYMTAPGTGLSDKPDPFRPWLMFPGTGMAHIMVPGH